MWETPYHTAHTDLSSAQFLCLQPPSSFFSDPINPARVRHRKTAILMTWLEFLFAPRTHQESNIVVSFAIQALSSSSCFIVNVDLGNWSFLRFWCGFGCRATKQATTTGHRGDIQFLLPLHALVFQEEEVPEKSRQSLPTRSRCCCCLRPSGQEDFLDRSHAFVCVCLYFFLCAFRQRILLVPRSISQVCH